MKIIIIDDDAIVASSMKTILTCDNEVEVLALGYDGKEAVSLYKEWKPDIILMDIQMKFMDGMTAIRKIREMLIDCNVSLRLSAWSDCVCKESGYRSK